MSGDVRIEWDKKALREMFKGGDMEQALNDAASEVERDLDAQALALLKGPKPRYPMFAHKVNVLRNTASAVVFPANRAANNVAVRHRLFSSYRPKQ